MLTENVVYQPNFEQSTLLEFPQRQTLQPPISRGRERFHLQERPSEVSEDKPFLLPGTGFDVRGQSNMWIRGFQKGFMDGIPFDVIVNDLRIKTLEDLKTGDDELIKQDKIFHSVLVKDLVSGKLICPRYNNAPLIDTISDQERNGVVKDAAIRVQDLLTGIDDEGKDLIQNGEVIVTKSPAGWSGLSDRKGGIIEFPDSYITLFQKQNGVIRHVILRTDLSLRQVEVLQRLLEQSKDKPIFNAADAVEQAQKIDNRLIPERERILTSTGEIAVLKNGEHSKRDMKEVLHLIQVIMKKDLICEGTRFDEVSEQLHQAEKMLKPDETAAFYMDRIDKFIKSKFLHLNYHQIEDNLIDSLEEELGRTFLELFHRRTVHKDLNSGFHKELRDDADYSRIDLTDFDMKKSLGGLQSVGGCNGGGRNAASASRFSSTSGIEGMGECKKIKCGRVSPEPCSWEASEAEAESIKRGELRCCPKCEWYPGKPAEPQLNLTKEAA